MILIKVFLFFFFLFPIYIKMGFDLMNWCENNQNVCLFILLLIVLQCTGYLTKILNMLGFEGFELGDLTTHGTIAAAEESGNEVQQAVTGLGRTPSSCYPQQKLTPEDLLPTDESNAIKE